MSRLRRLIATLTLRPFLYAILVALLTFVGMAASLEDALGSELRSAILFDERPIAPMRLEADIFAEVMGELDPSIVLLNVTEEGVVDRSGAPVEPTEFELLWVFQGDEISQTTLLWSDNVLGWLREYLDGANRGVILTGGAAALVKPLGFDPELQHSLVPFGIDRMQAGLKPLNSSTSVFAGIERPEIWITNAAFAAFTTFHLSHESSTILASSTRNGAGAGLAAILEPGTRRIRAFVFPWRISRLYDAAAEEFRQNYVQLLTNMSSLLGSELPEDATTAPRYVAPNFDALERALSWFNETYDFDEYPNGLWYETRLSELRTRFNNLLRAHETRGADFNFDAAAAELHREFLTLQREALLDNPEIDFDSFLYVRRNPNQLGLPENYNSNSVLPPIGYNDELRRFNLRTGESTLVWKSPNGEFIGDLELYYDASKVMFSSPDVNENYHWRVWELPLAESPEKQGTLTPEKLPLIEAPDVDSYDACYLPDDRIVFCSTACMTGVPCLNGMGHVCNLYRKDLDGSVCQLTLEQDHDWNPVVLNNGRVMYLRWEYVDLPHCFARIMFHMNPDGTNQSELYGSGSYWPTAIFGARPLPCDGSKFVGIVGGHHEVNRQGELVIFDPEKGRKETSGVVQRIPGFGQEVSPIACDLPIQQSWPKFLHPYPLTENTFLVSCKRSEESPWTLSLVDTFDNILTLFEEPDAALLEPIPIREREREPILPDRVDAASSTADVFIADVYEGVGLTGIPRGTVKALRVFSYGFSYQGMGAEPYSVGLDGPWDPRRIIGTVPVNDDGSAFFKIPAYTPISLQPLDADGRALQIMRSWITALPGETVSCVGCHEPQSSTTPATPRSTASQSAPVEIQPFYGPTRGFSFVREIQPILDKHCVRCHQEDSEAVKELVAAGVVDDGVWKKTRRPNERWEIGRLPDFRFGEAATHIEKGTYVAEKSPTTNSYYQLRRFLYTPTKESQMTPHLACEFSADLQPLVMLLKQGHFGVELEPEAWEKLYTWIDLNAPFFGNWGEILRQDNPVHVEKQWRRRDELRSLYAPSALELDDDPRQPVEASRLTETNLRVRFSITREEVADEMLGAESEGVEGRIETIPLNEEVSLTLVSIPTASFDVGVTEVTNEQYRAYDPEFDSGIEYGDFLQFSPGERGWLLSRAKQPVVRVTWDDAVKFCEWLSEKTGDEYRLPTVEERRLYAGNFGFWFGESDADYSFYENLADATYGEVSNFGYPDRDKTIPAWRPVDWDVCDASRVAANVGSYEPNPLGLFDVHGNVSEWTNSEALERREIVDVSTNTVLDVAERPLKLAAGGSWTTSAKDSVGDALRGYPDYFRLRDVGFRVVRVKKASK